MFTAKNIALALLLFFPIAGWLVYVWFVYGEDVAKFLGYLIAGLLALCQVVASNIRATAAEKTAEAMRKTTELTEKGHISERFKNSIEHLGSNSVSIRLGGIYALNYIAEEVHEYRKPVIEILCAHIRETTTQESYTPVDSGVPGKKVPTIEIETILRRLSALSQRIEPSEKISMDFQRANLQGADFIGANLRFAIFDHADLENAIFKDADLEKAMFLNSNLQFAILVNAKLRYSDFSFADLNETKLESANLRNANLHFARSLEADQLLEAETLYKAVLPDGMEEEIGSIISELKKKFE